MAHSTPYLQNHGTFHAIFCIARLLIMNKKISSSGSCKEIHSQITMENKTIHIHVYAKFVDINKNQNVWLWKHDVQYSLISLVTYIGAVYWSLGLDNRSVHCYAMYMPLSQIIWRLLQTLPLNSNDPYNIYRSKFTWNNRENCQDSISFVLRSIVYNPLTPHMKNRCRVMSFHTQYVVRPIKNLFSWHL
jgi:hypothetical protein